MAKEKYWCLEQSCYGHIHRFVYTESELKETMQKYGLDKKYDLNDILCDKDVQDIRFPISGSNSSATYFVECPTEKDVVAFLKSDVEVDYADPELIDLMEGMMTIETSDGCGNYFVEKYQFDEEPRYDPRLDDSEYMINKLKELGYKDFDFENPFYGENRDMRYSELSEIFEEYTKDIAEKTITFSKEEVDKQIEIYNTILHEQIWDNDNPEQYDDFIVFEFNALEKLGYDFSQVAEIGYPTTYFEYLMEHKDNDTIKQILDKNIPLFERLNVDTKDYYEEKDQIEEEVER